MAAPTVDWTLPGHQPSPMVFLHSPSNMELLIHCHCRGFYEHERADAPAIVEGIKALRWAGLIEKTENYWQTTPRGKAHLAQLCRVPFPEQAWANAQGEIIHD